MLPLTIESEREWSKRANLKSRADLTILTPPYEIGFTSASRLFVLLLWQTIRRRNGSVPETKEAVAYETAHRHPVWMYLEA